MPEMGGVRALHKLSNWLIAALYYSCVLSVFVCLFVFLFLCTFPYVFVFCSVFLCTSDSISGPRVFLSSILTFYKLVAI